MVHYVRNTAEVSLMVWGDAMAEADKACLLLPNPNAQDKSVANIIITDK